jgi:hypothetical protein
MLPAWRPLATVALLLICGTPAFALDGHWQPPGIHPTSATLASVLAARDAAAGTASPEYARRVERWTLQAGPTQLETTVTVRDADLRFQTRIAGALYVQGRAAGVRWRQTPNGLVRRIGADVQGDDLDRWPLALFPYAAADCRLLGETDEAPLRYVVEYRPEHDSPHWFFFDAASGRLTEEIEREGSRNVAFRFSVFRPIEGTLRPFAWHVNGAGGEADVAVATVDVHEIPPSAVALPASRSDALAAFEGDSADVPARFVRNRILVDATVNGEPGVFILDTGTTQILIDAGAAHRFGIQTTLGHGIVHDLSTGPVHFKDLAVQTAELTRFGADGILGFDYFAGHIVHIDYGLHRVLFSQRGSFVAPAEARKFAVDYAEGMPLAAASVGSFSASRIALDTGSSNVVLLRYLLEHGGASLADLGILEQQRVHAASYLEGTIALRDAAVPEIVFAGVRFRDDAVQLEVRNTGPAVDFPIDGIFGTQVLAQFEWWFDYDGGVAWVRLAQGLSPAAGGRSG